MAKIFIVLCVLCIVNLKIHPTGERMPPPAVAYCSIVSAFYAYAIHCSGAEDSAASKRVR